ncbi:MAG TPA: BTAD domain-containing putative transcriptional regulator [Micromonosporaceae bacterium]|nr:BTAD domain-containing putative transcriptional regulator [Micromonosporaceae bacterium]
MDGHSSDERPENRGLVRPRLLAQLDATRPTGLALVIAPAGFGKTTLLRQYAATHTGPVAWHSLSTDGSDRPAEPPAAERLTQAIRAASDTSDGNLLLIVDDSASLMDAHGEAAIEHFLAHRPAGTHVVLSGRRMPALNVLRHEVVALPAIIGADQLSFRTWEVERLLATVYAEPLPLDDVARLTRRTEGWPAGLAMFHLSTRGRPLAARQRAVAALSGRWAIARDYLARTLLAELTPEERDFVVRTSVFEVLTGSRCDRLLERSGSDRVLADLAHRYGLPIALDGGDSYRYHRVLRTHLAATLTEDIGEAQAAQWHSRAAHLLIADRAHAEAVGALGRAGDWATVRELLARVGPQLADHPDQLLDDALPAWLLAEEPWLVYGEARRRLAQGQLLAAVQALHEAEELFADEDGKRRCRSERRLIDGWLPGGTPGRGHWTGWLSTALRRSPGRVAGETAGLPGAGGELVGTIVEILTGNLREPLRRAAEFRSSDHRDSPIAALGLALIDAALRLVDGAPVGATTVESTAAAALALDSIADEATGLGLPWLSRMARAAHALGAAPDAAAQAYAVAAECERCGDEWGRVLATFQGCLREWRSGSPDPDRLAQLADGCAALGADVLQAWARALLALASADIGLPDAEAAANAAVDLAYAADVPGARVLATVALGQLDPARRGAALAEAAAEAEALGLPDGVLRRWLGSPAPVGAPVVTAVDRPLPIEIHCFGGFRMEIAGRPVDLTPVRRRARSALRLLAMQAGQVVHRELLIEALWRDLPPAAATRNLQVSISALRGLLEPTSERGKAHVLIRSGDAYGIALPPGGYADTAAFTDAVQRWQRTRHRRDPGAELAALREALSAYGGELLPEDGPADWAVQAREEFRRQATQVARALAVAELAQGNVAEAIAAAEYCITLDAHDDDSWRVLVRAYSDGGAPAKAVEIRRRYAEMLASLGLPGPEAGTGPAAAGPVGGHHGAASGIRTLPAQRVPPGSRAARRRRG